MPGQSSVGMADVAAGLKVETLTESVHGAIASSVFPRHTRDSAFDSALIQCVDGNVRSVLDIAGGHLTAGESDPQFALTFAAVVAELGIPFGTLERAYWVGVQRFLQEWFDGLRRIRGHGEGPSVDPTSAVFPYVMRVLDLVGDRYDAVERERSRTGEDRRRALVEQLLDGSVTHHVQEFDNLLRYRLRGAHIALLFETGDRAVVQRALARLCDQTGAWGSLVIQREASRWSVWLGYPKDLDDRKLHTVRRAIVNLDEPVAVGGPGVGIAGIRQSHLEACRAAELRPVLAAPPKCLWYRDVRLEAFLLDDTSAAQRFVAEELGVLADDTERAHRIRETLLASLATGSHARAAAELGVHENTVRLRVRSATEVLGEALTERRTELLVALRLRQALGGAQPGESIAVAVS
jgi:hypothetical protein